VLPNLTHDVIVGYTDIVKYNLLCLDDDSAVDNLTTSYIDSHGNAEGIAVMNKRSNSCKAHPHQDSVINLSTAHSLQVNSNTESNYSINDCAALKDNPINLGTTTVHMKHYIDTIVDSQGIEEKDDILEDTLNKSASSICKSEEPYIEGTPEFQRELRLLLAEFNDIFSTTLNKEPAAVPPMTIEFDKVAWKQMTANKGPPRQQSDKKEAEIIRQVTLLRDLDIIAPSKATEYSHVHLQAKPNDKWRFCVDLRNANTVSGTTGWRVPNIKDMLHRIGKSGSKYFAVMDLTSEYHQFPLAKNSRERSRDH
jgi:hypothetical protein